MKSRNCGLFLACRVGIGLALLWWVPRAVAQVDFAVTFENLAGGSNPTTTDLADALRRHAISGARSWIRWLAVDGPRRIDIVISISKTSTGRGDGRSETSSFVRKEGALNVYEQGVAAELRIGVDPNGTAPDVRFEIAPNYLRDQLWFDPDPDMRTAPVPDNRIDAFSFFAHEFGHALVFNGWHETATGRLPGDYESTYDRLSRYDGLNWWFTGPTAKALYGGEVPIDLTIT